MDENLMRQLGESLRPGGAAVIALVRKVSADKLLPQIEIPGKLIQTSPDNESEERLVDALTATGKS